MPPPGFEWDPNKARSNPAKHDVTFEVATLAFGDPNGFDELDDRESYDEERLNRFGIANGRILVVTHCLKGRHIRIISARRANAHEQNTYFKR